MDLSIVIVSYNTKDLLIQTLESVYQATDSLTKEVFVVDNASQDGSADAVAAQFPEAHLVRNEQNVGFSKANNQAIRNSSGRYVLLLNSDTVVSADTFAAMVRFMDEHPQAGAGGCKVVKPDGSLDLACRRSFPTPLNAMYQALKFDKLFPNSPHFAAYNMTYRDVNETYQVDCLVGAFMMLRRDVLAEVGLLDGRFFMYGEDVDWCYRIKRAGWEIWYYPETEIIHYKGASSKKKKVRMIYEFHRAMKLYYDKHHAPAKFFLVNWMVYGGIFARYALVMTANLFKKGGGRDDQVLSGVSQSTTHSS